MKKLLTLIISLFIVTLSFAQETISFKGIPIEGSMRNFCRELENKGFKNITESNKIALFSGNFAEKDVLIIVGSPDNGNNVSTVIVRFLVSDKWESLSSTYEYYKNLYIKKYGDPSISTEYNPISSESNKKIMKELRNGNIDYTTIWDVPGGGVQLSIETDPETKKGCVVVSYINPKNLSSNSEIDDI